MYVYRPVTDVVISGNYKVWMVLLEFVYVNLEIVEKTIFEGLSQVTTRPGRKVGTHHGETVEVCPKDSAFEVVVAFPASILDMVRADPG